MFSALPKTYADFENWTWADFTPYTEALLNRELTAATSHQWLLDYTTLTDMMVEMYTRLSVANSQNTADEVIEAKFNTFLETMFPELMRFADQANRKIADSGVNPERFEVALRNLKADIEIFREENLPLITETQKLGNEYDKVIGAQTIQWEGAEMTISQTQPLLQDQDRAKREAVWRAVAERQLADREAINSIWSKLVPLRVQIAKNAGFDNYIPYKWKEFKRFDYTPDDCMSFHRAIEEAVVPAAQRLYEKKRQQLGVESLRPWDTTVDPLGLPPLRPYQTLDELNRKMSQVFTKVDPKLGDYYDRMWELNLLDLENRKGKAPGGYCTTFPVQGVPFIFMNAVGLHNDVQTLLHEGGHSFHTFECMSLPYTHQREYPIEFAEVASMAMELLAAPYLAQSQGGFYTDAEAARARIEHLEDVLRFWPYMAVVDAFQHWVYNHPEQATDAANCDAAWGDLWDRFMVGIDYSGLDDVKVTGWHRKLHIHKIPFYYVEYGLAQLGAVQVYGKSLQNQASAVKNYLAGLALGYTVPLPQLFETAGAKLAFDTDTLQTAVDLIEGVVHELEPMVN